MVFFVPTPAPQNGQVLVSKFTDVRSKSAAPPDQASGSFSGSSPLNENFHVSFFTSISTYRFRPGQFESYTITRARFFDGYSIAKGVTACPPFGLYKPSV